MQPPLHSPESAIKWLDKQLTIIDGPTGFRDDKPQDLEPPSLSEFVRESWHVLEESTILRWNWHIEDVCNVIEELLRNWLDAKLNDKVLDIKNVKINVPPGTLKSRIISVDTPAWFWLIDPTWRVINISSNPRVVIRDAILCRDLITSPWYQNRFNPSWKLRQDKSAVSNYWTTRGGMRMAFSILAKATGDRGDAIFIDDPHDVQEVNSDVKRLQVTERWDNAIHNRVNDENISIRLLGGQRSHFNDLFGHVEKEGDWHSLVIPQKYDPETTKEGVFDWTDPRTEKGELLHEKRFNEEFLKKEKIRLGSIGYAAQHQQEPVEAKGGIVKRDWIQYLDVPPVITASVWSWDTNLEPTQESDYACGLYVGEFQKGWIILDGYHEKPEYPELKRGIKGKWAQKRGNALAIEKKASGHQLLQEFNRTRLPIVPMKPGARSKEERLKLITGYLEAGLLWIWSGLPWAEEFIDEICKFPKAEHDDYVDALVWAILWMLEYRELDFLAAVGE